MASLSAVAAGGMAGGRAGGRQQPVRRLFDQPPTSQLSLKQKPQLGDKPEADSVPWNRHTEVCMLGVLTRTPFLPNLRVQRPNISFLLERLVFF